MKTTNEGFLVNTLRRLPRHGVKALAAGAILIAAALPLAVATSAGAGTLGAVNFDTNFAAGGNAGTTGQTSGTSFGTGASGTVTITGTGLKGDGGNVTVTGKDVTAWVDIGFDGVGWVPFNPTPPSSAQLHVKNPPPTESNANQAQYQPPAQPLTNQSSALANAPSEGHASKSASPSILASVERIAKAVIILLLVAALLLGPAVLVIWAKSRRRARRRNAATPSGQIAGGWAEMLDRLADAGVKVSETSTRREQAAALGGSTVEMAEIANAATFGFSEPAPVEVESFWSMIDQAVRDRTSALNRRHRIWADINPRSLKAEVARFRVLSRKIATQ